MKLSDEQRIAVCCILLDVKHEMEGSASFEQSRHYLKLHDKIQLTDEDFQEALQTTVLSSLTIIGDLHYKIKMLIGLTVYDLYSQDNQATIRQKTTFSVLMNAIDWPISFSEINTLP